MDRVSALTGEVMPRAMMKAPARANHQSYDSNRDQAVLCTGEAGINLLSHRRFISVCGS